MEDDAALRLGWVVGLFEGEGYIGLKSPTRPELQLTSTDEDVVARLLEWTGVGTIHLTTPTDGRKPYWRWHVSKRDDAGALLERMLPYLGARRAAKAREAIAAWKSVPTKGTSPTCGYGHLLDADNMVMVDGRRRCRLCIARRQREYKERQAKKLAAAVNDATLSTLAPDTPAHGGSQ